MLSNLETNLSSAYQDMLSFRHCENLIPIVLKCPNVYFLPNVHSCTPEITLSYTSTQQQHSQFDIFQRTFYTNCQYTSLQQVWNHKTPLLARAILLKFRGHPERAKNTRKSVIGKFTKTFEHHNNPDDWKHFNLCPIWHNTRRWNVSQYYVWLGITLGELQPDL